MSIYLVPFSRVALEAMNTLCDLYFYIYNELALEAWADSSINYLGVYNIDHAHQLISSIQWLGLSIQ